MKKKITFKGKEFLGAGVVIYHGKKMLLQKAEDKDYWEDFGGRTDWGDKNIIETAFRECNEESNGILNEEFLKVQIEKDKKKSYYVLNNNKYFVYMIYVTRRCKDYLDSSLFGDMECHDGIKRKVEWVTKNKDLKLHPRL